MAGRLCVRVSLHVIKRETQSKREREPIDTEREGKSLSVCACVCECVHACMRASVSVGVGMESAVFFKQSFRISLDLSSPVG